MRPRVQIPPDLVEHEPRLATLRGRTPLTYERLFREANRSPEHLGWLVYDDGRPLSVRQLARRTRIPRTTLTTHLAELRRAGLLASNLFALHVPLVPEIERRYAAASMPSPPMPSPAQTPPTTGDAAVDNRPTLPWQRWPDSGPLLVHGPAPPQPHNPRVLMVENPMGSTTSNPVENPDWTDPWDIAGRLPREIEDSRVRSMLAKLACRFEQWRGVVLNARDRGALKRLYREHGPHLEDALEEVYLAPRQPRNPTGWLVAKVLRAAGLREPAGQRREAG